LAEAAAEMLLLRTSRQEKAFEIDLLESPECLVTDEGSQQQSEWLYALGLFDRIDASISQTVLLLIKACDVNVGLKFLQAGIGTCRLWISCRLIASHCRLLPLFASIQCYRARKRSGLSILSVCGALTGRVLAKLLRMWTRATS
jgi:hypothetical protein